MNVKYHFFKFIYLLNDLINPKHIKRNLSIFKESLLKFKNINFSEIEKKSHSFNDTVFMMGKSNIGDIFMQVPQIFACLRNNYKIIIFISSPTWSIQKIYKKLGVHDFIFFYQPLFHNSNNIVEKLYSDFKIDDYQGTIIYKGVDLLKLITSTKLRKEKKGNIDYRLENEKIIKKKILSSIKTLDFTNKMIQYFNPKKFFFEDRGYLPDGIFFETAINNNLDVIEFHAGHRSGILNYKRFNLKNRSKHPFSVSSKYLSSLFKNNINYKINNLVMGELKSCYEKGEWFDTVGSSFFKKKISKYEFIKKYKLNPKYPIAVLFSHVLYDATLFYGDDIFENYEDWLIKSIRYMSKVKNMNWIIKCHPQNAVKNVRDKLSYTEIDAIKNFFGSIPNHINVIDYDSNESTLSLYHFIDYCLTVRGTVGIEAACFGIPVITAGTGRYDNMGFTLDSSTVKQYYKKIENIKNFKKYSKKEINKAMKFAYATLISKQLKTEIIKFEYLKTKDARLSINITKVENLLGTNDVIKLSNWLQNKEEDLIN